MIVKVSSALYDTPCHSHSYNSTYSVTNLWTFIIFLFGHHWNDIWAPIMQLLRKRCLSYSNSHEFSLNLFPNETLHCHAVVPVVCSSDSTMDGKVWPGMCRYMPCSHATRPPSIVIVPHSNRHSNCILASFIHYSISIQSP